MIRLFSGFDRREEAGLHVFMSSVLTHATQPISFTSLTSMGLKEGSNAFTLSRFLVPAMCGFSGRAIFCDGTDMLAMDDIAKLDAMFDYRYAVQVVKHPEYTSLHEHKYVGTNMECRQSNYARKNWASVMLINCAHPAWLAIESVIAKSSMLEVLQFSFLNDGLIGALPAEWNVLVDEDQEAGEPKLLHWTAGIPHFQHYATARYSDAWFAARDAMLCEQRS